MKRNSNTNVVVDKWYLVVDGNSSYVTKENVSNLHDVVVVNISANEAANILALRLAREIKNKEEKED